MNIKTLLDYLEEHNFPSGKHLTNSTHSEFKKNVLNLTAFIDEDITDPPFGLRLSCIVEGHTEVPKCRCGNPVGYRRNAHTNQHYAAGFAVYCSLKCSNSDEAVKEKKKENTNYEEAIIKRKKFYKEHPEVWERKIENTKKTCNIRYGGHDSNLSTPEHRQYTTEKCMKDHDGKTSYMQVDEIKNKCKHGGKWYFETDDFKKKRDEDWERNGHPMVRPEVLEKRDRTLKEKTGRPLLSNPTQTHISDEALTVLNDKGLLSSLYEQKGFMAAVADVIGVHQSSVQRACTKLGIPAIENHSVSLQERKLREYVISLIGEDKVLCNVNKFGRNNFDIFIPEYNVAIEYNGVYWHSDKFKDKNYHQKKSLICKDNGILLIHIWEDDWKDETKREIIKHKIKSKLGLATGKVFARNTTVELVDYKEAHMFMEENHIQGKTTASAWIGLYHTGELVACVGIKKMNEDGDWDLVRYASKVSVVGGFTKILSFFKKNYDWRYIVTYAHLDYSHGKLYEVAGFTNEGYTVAGMWYVKGDTRYRRELFMKHKLPKLLQGYDESLTERENMEIHGFRRIYDAGSIKYTMTNNK
jgi:hypothetical protein